MFQTIKNAFQSPEIRKKIFITAILLLVYRLGCFVPIPGLDVASMGYTAIADTDFFQMLSAVTGSSFSNGTIFALGILPFINSFIIMQLLSLIIPKLEKLTKEGGEEGKRKITAYTRYLAILLAVVQGIGIMFAWQDYISPVFGDNPTEANKIFTMMCIVIILVGGSSFVMWLGERITEFGIGNGTSLIIFVGIISTLGNSILNALLVMPEDVKAGDTTGIWFLLAFFALLFVLFVFIIFVDMAVRKIQVQYAKQIKGNKMYGGQSTHIPIKVNAGGVMPIIFASSIIMFPEMILQFIGEKATTSGFGMFWSKWLGANGYLYAPVLCVFIIFFAYFYAQIQFNPDDVAKMLRENGGFIPGIRPGRATSDHLRTINNRLTLFGALFLAMVSLFPTLILQYVDGFQSLGLGNAFSATGLLITVSVALEFKQQLESQLLVKNNKGFLK